MNRRRFELTVFKPLAGARAFDDASASVFPDSFRDLVVRAALAGLVAAVLVVMFFM